MSDLTDRLNAWCNKVKAEDRHYTASLMQEAIDAIAELRSKYDTVEGMYLVQLTEKDRQIQRLEEEIGTLKNQLSNWRRKRPAMGRR